jgi:hypothetical protein
LTAHKTAESARKNHDEKCNEKDDKKKKKEAEKKKDEVLNAYLMR